jgi:tripartite-type tricarboxylate transporter receptor subunit TctC
MRRRLLQAGAGVLAGVASGQGHQAVRPALAQGASPAPAWPSRPIRLIMPYIPGSAPDVLMRVLVDRMGAILGQPIVIENRAGAGGTIGTEFAARAAPDGYTQLCGANTMVILPHLHRRPLGFDPIRDFTPIIGLTAIPHVLIVSNDGPRSLAELIAELKARPGTPYASGGNGTPAHLAAELFRVSAGVEITHVPFRGAPDIVNNVMSGQVRFGFPTQPTATELVRAGRLRALAVTSPERNHALPDVPTVAETLPGFSVVTWFGLLGPAGLPADVVRRVEAAARTALSDPQVKARIESDGSVVLGMPASQFADYYRADYARWGEAVRISGAQVD